MIFNAAYSFDLTSSLNPVNKISLAVKIDLGDAGRQKEEAADKLYTEGMHLYAQGEFESDRKMAPSFRAVSPLRSCQKESQPHKAPSIYIKESGTFKHCIKRRKQEYRLSEAMFQPAYSAEKPFLFAFLCYCRITYGCTNKKMFYGHCVRLPCFL